jgi:oligopeptide transport system ATP-binding protein
VTTASRIAGETLVSVEALKVYFPVAGILPFRRTAEIRAVDDVSLTIRRGETLGLVGESGSGKSTLGRTIIRLGNPTAGRVTYDGVDLSTLRPGRLRKMRHRFQIIYQDPYASLDPRMTVQRIVSEPLIVHGTVRGRQGRRDRVAEVLTMVGLDPSMADRYPHEFSGGQRQRIGIARAMAAQPEFVVADEPISALDVSIQAQIINLMIDLKTQLDLTFLFIAHDLSVVRHISDRIIVMYLGKLMEVADRDELFLNPLHPYTQALFSAAPIPDPEIESTRQRVILEGDIPSPANPPSGCVFRTRCPIATEECSREVPALRETKPGHFTACIKV